MNEALQSYSPTEKPLEYDSLVARDGCEVITGNDYLGWRAYDQICVFQHDSTNPLFTQPDTSSYSIGPLTEGEGTERPWNTFWSVWVGSAGIRKGKVGAVIPPANSTGEQSGLYPNTTTSKVAHAFSNNGLIVIGIQKNLTTIELKRTLPEGGFDLVTFSGRSPVMVSTSNLDTSIGTKSGVLVLYIKPERPMVIFGRFERDDVPFRTEHVLMPDLRVAPLRLIGARPEGRREVLRYIDVDGRDVTLTSPIYVVDASGDNQTGIECSLESGVAFNNVVKPDGQTDNSKITIAMAGGYVYAATVDIDSPNDPLPTETNTFNVTLEGGEVTMP